MEDERHGNNSRRVESFALTGAQSIDMIILFDRSLLTDMESVYRHATADDASLKQATCRTSPYAPLERMEDVPRNKIMYSAQSSVAYTVNRGAEQVTGNKLTSNPTDTFPKIIRDMKLQSAEK